MKCPVCGQTEFERKNGFEVCDVCGWEDDAVQRGDPDYTGGANWMSLNQARENYKTHGNKWSPEDKDAYKAYWKKWHEEHAAAV